MSKNEKSQVTKGSPLQPKGTMPADHLKRWKTSNLSGPVEKGRRGKLARETTRAWKTLILHRDPSVPYGRLPANLRGAIANLLTPMSRDQNYASRRDKTGGEGGEIIKVGGIATEVIT